MLIVIGAGGMALAQEASKPAQSNSEPFSDFLVADGQLELSDQGKGTLMLEARDAQAQLKVAFLGVNTSPASVALQKQLQLKPGVGLVVDSVEKGSPAEQAGLKEFDVLHMFDDQILINVEQLTVLVRNAGAGKDVKLTVIREGSPKTLNAKLAERDAQPMTLRLFRPDGAGGRLQGITFNNAPRAQTMTGLVRINTPDGKNQLQAACVNIVSDKHKMTINNVDGRKHLKIEDKAGKVLFDGPISTKEELDKVPADLRQAYTDILLDYSADVKAPAVAPGTPPVPGGLTPEKKP
jgi:hypothetical protein